MEENNDATIIIKKIKQNMLEIKADKTDVNILISKLYSIVNTSQIEEEIDSEQFAQRVAFINAKLEDIFEPMDKNNPAVLAVLLEARKEIGALIGELIIKNQEKFIEEEKMKTEEKIEEAEIETTEATETLKNKLKDTKEKVEEASSSCGDYWDMKNIAIAAGVTTIVAAGAAYLGYRYGYNKGQEECPVIINVGQLD